MIARAFAFAVIGAQQRELEQHLPAFDARPVQQPMRVERVVHMRTRTECEANARAALPDQPLRLFDLRGRAAVFASQILDDDFALGTHLRVEFERMNDDFRLDDIRKAR